jgi:hypothetical protein
MISTNGPPAAASSDSTLSTIARPLNAGAAGGGSAPPVAAWTAPSRASQNSCASGCPGLTDTKATRRCCPGRSAHVRSSDVLPLPAGAGMTVTRLPAARSSVMSRS